MEHKATNRPLDHDYLSARAFGVVQKGFEVPMWIRFCQALLNEGYSLTLYEARKTVSKYVTVSDGQRQFKVRFSNHKPIQARELSVDCDFFVGVTNLGVTNTSAAMAAVDAFFSKEKA